jgi:multicomponent Na+:H+ antiporter subunit D
MFNNFVISQYFLISSLTIALANLLTVFISKNHTNIRIFSMLFVSAIFFINIMLLDNIFLENINSNIKIPIYGRYYIYFSLEPIGLIFLNLVSFLWICAIAYSAKFLSLNKIENSQKFLFFMNLSIIITILISLSANLFSLFIFYELLTLTTLVLVSHMGGTNVIAGVRIYFKILMISAGLLFLPAVIIIYTKCGHGNFTNFGFIQDHFSKFETIILLLMFIFGIAKTSIFPLHCWLPSAMVAIYPVSALLHAVIVVKTGLFCLYKILIYVFGLKYLYFLFTGENYFIYLPLFGIIYASIKTLKTHNIKTILAYSTISQLHISMLSAFMFTPKSMGAAILHMIAHSFTKICLFYGMGNIYSLTKATNIEDIEGIYYSLPKTSIIILIASLSLIGLPPLAGFLSKFYILLACAEEKQYILIISLIASSFVTILYLYKINNFIFKKPIKMPINIESQIPKIMFFGLVLCVIGIIIFPILQLYIIKNFLFYI